VDFATDARFDNPRAVQIRLPGLISSRCLPWRARAGHLCEGAAAADRIASVADDAYLGELASAVTGELGGKVGIAPRLFLKKLVATCWTESISSRTSTRASTTRSPCRTPTDSVRARNRRAESVDDIDP